MNLPNEPDAALKELRPFFDSEQRLTAMPSKYRKKLLALWYLAQKLDGGRTYTEPEINDLLDAWALFDDPSTLRRALYNKMLLNRTNDCKTYWKADVIPPLTDFLARYL